MKRALPALLVTTALLVAPSLGSAQEPGLLFPVPSQELRVTLEHLADRYPGTPGDRGLIAVATDDAAVADSFAALAAGDSVSLSAMRRYAGYVLNAVDPTLVPSGPGTGYGLRPATDAIAREIQLTADTDSVDAGIRMRTEHIAAAADNLVRWTAEAVALADQLRAASDLASATQTADRLASVTDAIARGVDRNGDGLRGWPDGDEGLEQVADHLTSIRRMEGWRR